jgi:cytochrome c-type biogenesis protein CcmH
MVLARSYSTMSYVAPDCLVRELEVNGSDMLWICLALLTAAVVLALARPLSRTQDAAADPASADLAVYHDQLTEIDNDRERGLIGGAEAEAARAEVARRLIHVSKTSGAKSARSSSKKVAQPTGVPSLRAVQGVLAALPLAGIGLYLWMGSPNLPGQPLAERQAAPAATSPVEDLVGRVEAELKKNSNDARGWTVIAPVYMQMKRYDDAAYAYSQIMRLNGEAIEPLLGFAEAALLANNGVVNDGVKRAAERALVIKPDRIEPKVWLALGKQQEGDVKGAIAGYKALLASSPPDAPWVDPITQQLKRLESGDVPAASNAPPQSVSSSPAKPSAGDIAALPPEEQQKQIAAMVNGLAERLKQNGDDLGGWQRLVRAYQVMGRKDDAIAALASARKQFAAKPDALADLDSLAKSLGL